MRPNRIINYEKLATDKPRRDALEILEAGYDAVLTERVIQENISVTGDVINIRGRTFDMRPFKNVYLVGFGKGACSATYELYKILSTRLKKTVVIDRTILTTCPSAIEAFVGTHPMPSDANVEATKVVMGVAEEAGEDDLVFVIVAGGGSSLLCSSSAECDQNIKLFEDFEHVGATIRELNTVRKHIADLKGGGLAEALYPATVIGLVFSDIVGGNPEEVASGPTYPDTSTNADAQEILKRYKLEDKFVLRETPKDPKYFEKVTNIVLISNEDSIQKMADAARSLGYEALILDKPLYEFPGPALAKIFGQSAAGRVVLAGGEVQLQIPEDHGTGGRCQFLAMEALRALGPDDVFVAAASDGSDNSDEAGAIVDGGTIQRIEEKKIDLAPYRARLDTIPVFEATGDEILTGRLDANVSDWYFLLTPR
ncbi:DUF4147 domain-containing protein [Candidatus Kaiserbacteria bacterium]|nr:DUF4147 domain-containing protein [Candidatus Kaiserbacteria bacterium]